MSASKTKTAGRPVVYFGAQAKAMALLAVIYGLANAIKVLTAKTGTKYAALRGKAITDGVASLATLASISKPTLGKLRDTLCPEREHTGRGRPSFASQEKFEADAQKAYDKLKSGKVAKKDKVVVPVVAETPAEAA